MGYCSQCGRHHHVGFISTRFAGTDGVSLETAKWADVFEQVGFSCFYFAGELDRTPECSFLVRRRPDFGNLIQGGLRATLGCRVFS